MRRAVKPLSVFLLYTFGLDTAGLAQVRALAPTWRPVASVASLPQAPSPPAPRPLPPVDATAGAPLPLAAARLLPAPVATAGEAQGGSGHAPNPADVDLRTWSVEGPVQGAGWHPAADGRSVVQAIGGEPSFFVSPDLHVNTVVRGRVKVASGASGAGFVGLVFGYQSPLAAAGHDPDQFDLVLFDWKRQTEVRDGAAALEGFTLSSLRGRVTDAWETLGRHAPGPQLELLAASQRRGTGWRRGREYTFEVSYRRSQIRIEVDGKEIFDVEGSFGEGRLGLYTYSQGDVTFRDVTVQPVNTAAVADAGDDQLTEPGPACLARVVLDGTASRDADGDRLSYTWTGPFGTAEGPKPTVSLPPGVHTMTLAVDDGSGQAASDDVEVMVSDRQAPVLACPASVRLTAAPPVPASAVTLGQPQASDHCEVASLSHDAPAAFALGNTRVTWTASDRAGNLSSCSQTVSVAAPDAPSVSVSLEHSVLWPPNHELIDVGLGVVASDPSGVRPALHVAVWGDEPEEDATGDGNHFPDAQVDPDRLWLRSERKGDADGRVYLIVVTATNGAGASTHACATVVVPHDQSAPSLPEVQAQAAAALAHCSAEGGAPPGYYLLGQGPFTAADPTLPLRPIVECVVEHGGDAFTAVFGYENENPVPVYLPVGPDNRFDPVPVDRGQPTAFQPGRTPAEEGSFAVGFGGGDLTWTLRGSSATASAASIRCTAPLGTPEPRDDEASTLEDIPVTIPVLANDTDPQGDVLHVLRVGPAGQGTVLLNLDGIVTYTPNAGFVGADTFTYTVTDSKVGTGQALVRVTVLRRNQAPSVDAGPDQAIHVATAQLSATVADDGRPPGGGLTVTWSLSSGPAPVTFSDPASPLTQVSFSLAGSYVLRVTASDSELSASDELTVLVTPSVSIQDVALAEGHAGLADAVASVTLSIPSGEPVSVDVVTADGSAGAGCDYLARAATIRFAPGETSHEFIVPVVGELALEGDETVALALGNVVGGVAGDASGTLTIQNDDAANQPPSALSDRSPADGASALPMNPTLTWTATDPDGDPLRYDVYFGTSAGTDGQSWATLCPAVAGPGPRAGAASAYDEATDRLVIVGGQISATDDGADVWILSHATGAGGVPAWSPVSVAGGPTPRQQAAAAFDPATGSLILHGGCAGSCTSSLADAWVLTGANGTGGAPAWVELPQAGVARAAHAAAYDAAHNRLIVFGGFDAATGGDRNDVWVLQDANGAGSPAWQQLAPAGDLPSARRAATAVYDAASNRLIVFGGRQAGDVVLNDVWVLTNANGLGGTPAWTPVAPGGAAPAPRWGHSAAYDPVSRRMLVFGGTGVGIESDRNLVANDLWLLSEADGVGSPAWLRLAPVAGPPDGRFLSSSAYSTTLNRLIVTLGANNRVAPALRDDLWVLSDAVGSLPLVSTDQSENAYDAATPAASETYFWRVFARDAHGAVTGSHVWRFRPNAPPAVEAGAGQTIVYPASSTTLQGAVSDDGLPQGGALTTSWSLVSGPGSVTFGDASRVDTTVEFSQDGTWVLRLTASDGELSASDEVTVVVTARPSAGRTYTSNADFDAGTSTAVDHSTPDQLQLDGEPRNFGFLWVAVSTKGTAVKIDTLTGAIKGEYRTAPQGQPTDPSRTTVDLNGNVWTANRAGNSVVHIGLQENGQCVDRNGNGVIDTSTGANDIRAWSNALGADTNGGVSTAADECVIHYVRVSSFGTRHVSVDRNNDVWVSGTSGRRFDLIDGGTGVIKRQEPSVGFGGYGGLIDGNGVIWSARPLLRWDTSRPLSGPNGGNWTGFGHDSYGLCIDSQGNVWETALFGNILRKWAPDGRLLGSFQHGFNTAQGCVVDHDDDVWVAHSLLGSNSVGHVKNNGTFVGNVIVGSNPTGVAVDSAGKIWATNYNGANVSRINPLGGPIGLDGVTRVGVVDFTSVNLGGNPYNYSDMTGSTLTAPPEIGNWTVVFDSALAGAEWGTVTWNASVCGDGALTVSAASSDNGVSFSAPQPVTPGADLSVPNGRYLRVTATLRRATTGESPILYDLSVGTVGYPLLPPTPPNAAPSVNAGTDQRVVFPRKATLEGTACDDGRPGPLSISWQQLSGPGTTTFTPASAAYTKASFSSPGSYVLRLSAGDSALTSSDDVTVIAAEPTCVAPPFGMVSWWPGDGNANDVVNGRRGNIFGGMVFGAGMVGQAFNFDGGDDHVQVPASPELNVQSFTLDAWVFPTAVNISRPILEWGQPGVFGVHLWHGFNASVGNSPGTLYANLVDVNGVGHTLTSAPGLVALNQWTHVAVTYDPATGQGRLYVNGAVVASGSLGAFTLRTALPFNIGFRPNGSQRFVGRIDEVELFSRALTAVEIEDIYLAGALGKCKTPNDRPIVDAGEDQVLVLPANATTLSGSVTDDGRPPGGGLTVSWTQVSGPAAAVFGSPTALQTTVTFPAAGVYVLKLTANDSELSGNDDVVVTVNPRSDLTVRALDVTGVVYDGQTLDVSGSAAAEIANIGAGPAGRAFSVAFFEDHNGNGTFEAGIDALLGTGEQDDLASGASAIVAAALSGTVSFRGNLIYAFVDSAGVIAEGNEANNYASSAPPCEAAPSPGPFAPLLEWSWSGSTVVPSSSQVMMAPSVADLNADGVPDVVFSTFIGANYTTNGHLRAVSGRDGSALFTVTNPAHLVSGAASVAVGDIDGDGRPEILAGHQSNNQIIAFEHDGTFKWLSPALENVQWGGATLADLDGNGVPEIVVGRQVLNANGTLRWTGGAPLATGRGGVHGPLAVVADLDMDGRPEVVAGNTAYTATGTIHWRNTAVPDGFTAVANFDADLFPEIVLVAGGQVRLLEHDGTLKWGPVAIPGGGQGGPPTVGDFDDDGQPEIGVAGGSRYVVIETNGTLKWQAVTQDISSNVTGSAVFDFEGDGSVEVVYADERMLRVYRGSDGVVLWETPRPSGTTYELPIVVDVDGDGRAEIVVPSNNYSVAGPTGLQVYGADNWVATRRIWNQHTYHITNVNDDATIPASEPNNWVTYNNYRQNRLTVGCEISKPDLTASFVRTAETAGGLELTARIGNGGGSTVAAGVPVSFYDGDPAGGRLLGTAQTAGALAPGRFEDVTLAVPLGTVALPLWVVADDQGGLAGTVDESDETNNAYNSRIFLTAAPNQPPTVDAGPDRESTLPAGTLTLDGTVSDDGLPINQLTISWGVVSGPGAVVFGSSAAEDTSATFTVAGTYLLRLTASDGDLTAADDVTVTIHPANQPPSVNAGPDQSITSATTTLAGLVTDDGLPTGSVLTIAWTVVSGPGSVTFGQPAAATTSATFGADGEYLLRLSASDGELSAQDEVRVLVARQNQAPSVNAGPDQTLILPANVLAIDGSVSDDGLPAGSSLSVTWKQVSGPAPVVFSPPDAAHTTVTFSDPGLYVLRLEATDSMLVGSDQVSVAVQPAAPVGDPPTVAITSPPEGASVTERVNVVGSAQSATLASWRLEHRLTSETSWTRFAGGTTAPAGGVLAAFDPTLLLNGIYEVRLVATDISGRSTSTSFTAVVKGEQKVGLFSLSFIDLEVPVSGMPIRVTRTYDSRDKRRGDFGVGWRLELTNARVEESGELGRDWSGTRSGGFFPTYCVEPDRSHIVSFTLPDGRVQAFDMELNPSCQVLFPVQFAQVTFRPSPDTLGTLVPVDSRDVWVVAGWPGPAELYDDGSFEPYDPSVYQYTSPEGDVYLIHQRDGLQHITDANGNRLTFSAAGVQHSSGKGVVVSRDGSGRVTSISDPAGRPMSYTYDAAGDLVSHADRESNRTTFTYNSTHGLLTIEDPRGIQPIRNEYDETGRLIRHTDAFGKTIEYTHNLNTRQQVVTDRMGRIRVLDYDAQGNVVREVDPLGGVTQRTFDARRNRTSETNPLGQTTTFLYDAQDNLLRETDALGNVLEYTFNARKQVLTVRDPLGRVTTNAYDAKGNLTSTTDASGNVVSFTYDARGNQTSRTATIDGAACLTRFEYDEFGNLVKETDALGKVTSYTYDANGSRLTETRTRTTPSGSEMLITTNDYDDNGRLIRTTAPDGGVTQTVYDALGNRVESIDPLGRSTGYVYDSMNRLTRTTYADGTNEQSSYDAEGRRTGFTDRGGRLTSYEYDVLGRRVKVTYPDGSVTTDQYDGAGRRLAATDARGKTTTYTYDSAGRRTGSKDPLDNQMAFGYDKAGNQVSTTDPKGQTTTYEYDALNRRTKTVFPDGSAATTAHDHLGRVRSETDQAGKITRFEYDCLGQLAKVVDPLGQETTYAYDEVGNRVAQADANGHTTRFEHDKVGRPTKRTLPGGAFETMSYDAAGNLRAKRDFAGRTTDHAYDSVNRLQSRSYPDGTATSFTYTQTGRRLTATDARGTTTYGYDLRDRLASLTYPDSRKLEYGHDGHGNRTSLAATLGSALLTSSYAYDDASRLDVVTDPLGRAYDFGYDRNGNRESLLHPNGARTSYVYSSLNRLTSLSTTGPLGLVQSYAFTLGPAGNRLRIDEGDGTSRAYTYDDLYRLTRETVTLGALPDYEKSFSYDPVGNRLRQTTAGAGAPGTPSAPGTVDYTYDERDRLLTENAGNYGYDDNGNLVTRSGEASYVWDFNNWLVRVEKADGTIVTHAYDADGNRVQTRVTPATGPPSTTNFLVDTSGSLSHVVAETDAADVLQAYYLRGGDDLLSVLRPSGPGSFATRFYHADGVGSVRRLTDEAGLITDGYSYTAFGETLAHTGTDPQPYAFAGEPYDPNAGFYYNRARWLDPRVGRFLSLDPQLGSPFEPVSLHRYLYAGNDPVDNVDPSGESFLGVGMSMAMNIGMRIQAIAVSVAFMAIMRAQMLIVHFANFASRLRISMFEGLTRYNQLLQQAIAKYPGKAGRIEQHHVLSEYIVGHLRAAGVYVPEFIARWTVPVNAAYHQLITNAIRDEFGFGKYVFSKHPADLAKVLMGLIKAYMKVPLPPG